MRKVPQMGTVQDQTLSITPNSGLNIAKLPNEIDDTQLSDGLNLYYKNSMLRFRPGLIKQITQTYGKIIDVFPRDEGQLLLKRDLNTRAETYGIFILTEQYALVYDGVSISQVITQVLWDGQPHGNVTPVYVASDFSTSRFIPAPLNTTTTFVSSIVYLIGNNQISTVGWQGDNGGVEGSYWSYTGYLSIPISNIIASSLTFQNRTPYIPTIYINMKSSDSGDKNGGRNYLTPKVINSITTDGMSTVYYLIDQNLDNDVVSISYNALSGTTYTCSFVANVTSATINGITVTLGRTAGTLTFSSHLVAAATTEATNNMTVQYAKTVYTAPVPITKCTMSAWFGGSYQGENSGDSLFVSGNPDEPNAVYWSAVNDPTYWPDDNVDYIGYPSDPIIAFGKNFKVLVIFKKNSVYEKGFVWDSTTLMQYFPTSEIHVGIGCDCPNSIQFINNNLTWLNSKGGVYTIATTNITNERVVVPLSFNIKPDLLSESVSDLQSAVSADDGYYYYLFIGTHVYLWDYNTTAFINYSDLIKLQNRLAWYKWTLPHALTVAFLYNNRIWGAGKDDNALYALDETKCLDEGSAWYDVHLISKAYDLNAPNILKQFYYISVSLTCVGTVNAGISIIDDYDSQDIVETLEGGNTETLITFSYRQPTGFTRYFKLEIKRIETENGAFSINGFTAMAKIGREV
jgi:hypothetical protein